MKVVVLSSGSCGNTTYIECDNIKILIDIGNTCKYVTDKLKEIGVEAKDIDAILITHTHIDHIKGLEVFVKKFGTKVYFTNKIKDELSYVKNYNIISNYNDFNIGNMLVHVIKTSHDVIDSVGYIIDGAGKSVVYITDTGYINQKYFSSLQNKDLYIMESNHDVELLNNSSYSFQLRQRILSDKGHLSNYDSALYLSKFIGNKTKCIILAHLSVENNTEELASGALTERLKMNNQVVEKIIIAKPKIVTEEVII